MLRKKREATCQLKESNRLLALASPPHDDVLLGSRSDFLQAEAVRDKHLRANAMNDRDFKMETEKNKELQLRVAALEDMIRALQESNRRDWEHMFAQVTALLKNTTPQRLNQDMPMDPSQSSTAAIDLVTPQISADPSTTQANGDDQRVSATSSLEKSATEPLADGTASKPIRAPKGEPCPSGQMMSSSRDGTDRTAASKGTRQGKKKRRYFNATP
ncbi:MAG: hypothetical protein Q9183_007620, partial [Haloplaca sp. 2 TL-2023]